MKTKAVNSQRELVRGSQIVEKNKDETQMPNSARRFSQLMPFFFQLLDPPKPEEKSAVVPSSGRACRYGNACTRPDCKFRHDRDVTSEEGYGTSFNVQKSSFARDSFPSRKLFDTPAQTREKREDQRIRDLSH